MFKLSIVIAATEGSERLESGLVSVLQHRPHNSEVLVILPEPYDDPYELEDDEVSFIEARRGARLVECLNLGWQACASPIVHFLASGAEVAADWADHALESFADPQVAAVAPLVLWGAERGESTYSAGVTYSAGGGLGMLVPPAGIASSRANVLGPHLDAAFYRKSALEAVGGIVTGFGERLAEVDLALALQQVGCRAVFEPASRVAIPWAYPAARNGFLHGLGAERVFWRNAAQAGWMRSLAAHPWTILGDGLRRSPHIAAPTQWLGRLAAGLQFGRFAQRREQLRRAALTLAEESVRTAIGTGGDSHDSPTHLSFDAAKSLRSAAQASVRKSA